MPWPQEHKAETRLRIVNAAAAAFRERGVHDVGVAELMRLADLTHGGFYGHFKSKDDVVTAAVAHAGLESDDSLARLAAADARSDVLADADAYLSEAHMAHPELGCPIAANGAELARGSRKLRHAAAAEIRRRLARLIERLPGRRTVARRRRDASGALACMVGGMVLARALPEAEATALLADVRTFLRDAIASG